MSNSNYWIFTSILQNNSKIFQKILECDVVIGTVQNMFGLSKWFKFVNKYKCDHLTKN